MEKGAFNILVVDDEKDWRETNKKTLAAEGFSVIAAGSGDEALALAGKHKFHMAFLDITMPDMDGLVLLKKLKELDPDIQAVMLTGYATVDRAGIAHQEGIVDFLEKIADDPDEKSLGDEMVSVAEQVFGELNRKEKTL